MKAFINLCVPALVLLARVGWAGSGMDRAYVDGAESKIVYCVVDEKGAPVADAKVKVWYKSDGRPQDNAVEILKTGSDGNVVAHHRVNMSVGCIVEKGGYYRSYDERVYSYSDSNAVVKGQWQPYGERRKVLLRPIKEPGRLKVFPKAMEMRKNRIPKWNEWVGFDLEHFDWTSPYGGGNHEDVQLRFRKEVRDGFFNCKFEMDVSFENNRCAGAYVRKKNQQSDLKWDYLADPAEEYKSHFEYSVDGKISPEKNCLSEDSVLVFRTRTQVDDNGHLKSAHYGVISGEWFLGSRNMLMHDGCFNPVPNDLNLEDSLDLRLAIQGRSKE